MGMKTTQAYGKYNVTVRFGSTVRFFYGLVAISAEAALADIVAAYGDCALVQYGSAS